MALLGPGETSERLPRCRIDGRADRPPRAGELTGQPLILPPRDPERLMGFCLRSVCCIGLRVSRGWQCRAVVSRGRHRSLRPSSPSAAVLSPPEPVPARAGCSHFVGGFHEGECPALGLQRGGTVRIAAGPKA